MSQNKPTGGSTGQDRTATGGAGTGATDAGTTRATSGAGTTGSMGSTGASSTSGGSGSTGGMSGGTGGAGSHGSSTSMTPSTSGSTKGGQGASGTATGLQAQAQEYGQKIADAASQAKDYVSDKVSVVGDKFKELQNKDLNEVADQAKDYARQNPAQAILISAGVGLVLGLLLRSGRR